jgi:hypothetical protein
MAAAPSAIAGARAPKLPFYAGSKRPSRGAHELSVESQTPQRLAGCGPAADGRQRLGGQDVAFRHRGGGHPYFGSAAVAHRGR